jgi:L-ascorbate metabolism protein UlaG (beta-lactamase superfamily)
MKALRTVSIRFVSIVVAVLAFASAWERAARAMAQAASPPAALALRYVANAGVLVTLGDVRVLIDAPIREGIPPYATSDAAERDRLERARPPYDRVDAILITHWHEDHFNAEAVAAHLSLNGRATLISSPEVVARVRAAAPHLPAARLQGVLPAPGASTLLRVGGLPVRVLRIRHVGFLIGEREAVLHTGDADPAADNFALLRALPPVDLALVPFWFMQSASNRQFVRDSIAPRRVVALHLPPDDADDVQRAFTQASVSAVLLTQPGRDVVLPR